MKKTVGIILIVIGIGTILYALVNRIRYDNVNKRLVEVYEAEYFEETTISYLGDFSYSQDTDAVREGAFDELPVDVIGVIKIQKIGLEAAIAEGSDYNTIKYSIGHFEETPLPDEKGNFCILGHRSYTYGQFFNRVDELETGDLVEVNIKGISYEYEIYDIYVTPPTNVGVLDNSQRDEITIVTCTSDGKNRVIIKGVKI